MFEHFQKSRLFQAAALTAAMAMLPTVVVRAPAAPQGSSRQFAPEPIPVAKERAAASYVFDLNEDTRRAILKHVRGTGEGSLLSAEEITVANILWDVADSPDTFTIELRKLLTKEADVRNRIISRLILRALREGELGVIGTIFAVTGAQIQFKCYSDSYRGEEPLLCGWEKLAAHGWVVNRIDGLTPEETKALGDFKPFNIPPGGLERVIEIFRRIGDANERIQGNTVPSR